MLARRSAAARRRESWFPPSGSPNPSLRPLSKSGTVPGNLPGDTKTRQRRRAPLSTLRRGASLRGARPRPLGVPVPGSATRRLTPSGATSPRVRARWSACGARRYISSPSARSFPRRRASASADRVGERVPPHGAPSRPVSRYGKACAAGFRAGWPNPGHQVAVDSRRAGDALRAPRLRAATDARRLDFMAGGRPCRAAADLVRDCRPPRTALGACPTGTPPSLASARSAPATSAASFCGPPGTDTGSAS